MADKDTVWLTDMCENIWIKPAQICPAYQETEIGSGTGG